ncbi:hypothetical protein FDV58_17675 [Bradyrhizobium elkanii]|uniref:Uncharacterized protein n=1 Tax=Bradyrhizobium elkanii TaxID=29448 RepID=A0A4U6RZL4_BRAEL|nr:hypothetical protein [Bradyrhizobium elkanii]TKV80081.1 hypothetical protein FDV58_17675 [Bradyrhizobium elkanii]
MLPLAVSPKAENVLSTERMQGLVDRIRTSSPSLEEQMKTLAHTLGNASDQVALLSKAPTTGSKLDRYDWFFGVERIEQDSELTGLVALFRTMTDYGDLIASRTMISELEQAAITEAVQAIIENYGEGI